MAVDVKHESALTSTALAVTVASRRRTNAAALPTTTRSEEKALGYRTDGLTFNTLRGGNRARLPEFKNKHGKPAHSKADGSDWSDAEWLQAVVGELGEYANIRKKLQRGDLTREEAQSLMADELADVVIYLDLLAFRLDINLGQAVMEKFNRTSMRVGCGIYIAPDDWHRKPT